jgi:hypothetical protein
MTKNRSLTVMVVVLAAAVLLTGGLMASNMGFKLNRALLAGSDPGSNSGTQTLGLPYNRQVGIDNASDLYKDIGTAQNIQGYNTATDGFVFYSFGTPDFALEAGKGLFVKVGSNTNYIIVGSHDPSAVIQLESAGAASNSGTNLYAPPYHATAATARALYEELGSAQNIQGYNTANDGYVFYSFGTPDFNITPGEAYFVKMGATVAYSPSHY